MKLLSGQNLLMFVLLLIEFDLPENRRYFLVAGKAAAWCDNALKGRVDEGLRTLLVYLCSVQAGHRKTFGVILGVGKRGEGRGVGK